MTRFDRAADYLPSPLAPPDSRDASIAEAAPATPAFVPPAPPPLRLMEQPRIQPGETVRVETERVAPRKPTPAAASPRTSVSYPPARPFPSKLLAAAAVLLAVAVGLPLGARWLDVQGLLTAGGEAPPDQTVPVEESVTAEREEAAPPNRPPAKAAAAGKPAPGAAPAKPRAAGAARTPAKTAAASGQPDPQAAPVSSAPAPEVEAAVEPPATAATASAAAMPSVAPTAPRGKLFEPTEVDEPPQIASRVEPRLPPDLPPLRSDLVVVRVLVSQTGHPFRVSLLRKSRLGRALDDAVIEAVTQWTFAPARKRGEAVNAWYHIGVPLGGGD